MGIVERWWNPGGFNGNKTTESRERTEDERTETTIPEAVGWAFLGWMERNAERLCELCASVVIINKGHNKNSVFSVPLW